MSDKCPFGTQARGLDVLPTTISRFRAGGDEETAKLLEDIIYPEEITHCAAGVRWFRYLCLRSLASDPIAPPVPQPKPQCSAELPEGRTGDDSKTSQAVHDGLADKPTEDINSRDETIQQAEDGLARCGLGENGDTDEMAIIERFHSIVREHFRGPLKPPFNAEARKAAGFGPAWYEPLAVKEAETQAIEQSE
ncbi:unnamed protein product [Triticum turgidum subsp. durum]|uniref:Uncharacterized protein n=1 Tax=Triticum turgidum subsp. durum TaxID=4567 RepID=A0A9R0YUZ1_TRITD|nr:unnamed protein product [Triticum turgidum subsp. durum]